MIEKSPPGALLTARPDELADSRESHDEESSRGGKFDDSIEQYSRPFYTTQSVPKVKRFEKRISREFVR